ncbi:MAG: putative toxin-antitoxin system toxin component, PIN family [Bacteroidales bacterium]|nr:putative toxin-antitoxin system toxin component, PIN family [Bacteroidales bacterium]
MKRVVLDTNCLLASLSSRSENFIAWRSLHEGKYILCVSNEILSEYEEIIASKTNTLIAENVINAIADSRFVEFIDPQFRLNLIEVDKDDNKFVDCAFASNATFIVSNDKHFDILSMISFPKINVLKMNEFIKTLK